MAKPNKISGDIPLKGVSPSWSFGIFFAENFVFINNCPVMSDC